MDYANIHVEVQCTNCSETLQVCDVDTTASTVRIYVSTEACTCKEQPEEQPEEQPNE